MEADGRWQWDDANHTNQPVATFDLVNGQEDYAVMVPAPTVLQDWLLVEQVEILDANDEGILLQPIDKRDPKVAWSEFQEDNSTPRYYDFQGASIYLKPNPNYDKTNGGIITFKRHPSYFEITDTTKRPGFARLFHRFLSFSASYDWFVKIGNINKANVMKNEMLSLEVAIKKHYSKRSKFEVPKLARAYKQYK